REGAGRRAFRQGVLTRLRHARGDLGLPLADEQAVDDERDSDHEGDHAGDPDAAQYLRVARRVLTAEDDALHQDVEEDHHADAGAGGDDAALDLVVALHLGGDAAQPLELFPAPLALAFGEEHLRDPGLAPVELLARLARLDRLAHDVQVRAASLAEPQIVALAGAAFRTEHRVASVGRFYRRIR